MKISYKVLFVAVLSIAGTNAFAADITGLATTNYVKGAIDSLDSDVATGDGAIDTITQTGGKITATHRKLSNKDIADGAAIATSKISGLDTELGKKQLKENIVNVTVSDGPDGKQVVTYSKGDATSTDNYPSVKAANQIAAAAAANATLELTSDVSSLHDGLTDLTQAVQDNMAAADDAIKALDGTGTGTTDGNGMVKLVTQTDGKVTATRALVAVGDIDTSAVIEGKIAADAVTTTKIKNANVTKVKLASDVQTSLVKADNSLQKATNATYTNGHVLKVDASGNVVDGGALGSLATQSKVTDTYIDDGAISQAKINGLTSALSGKQATLTTGDGGNIKGSGSVTVTKDASGVITVSGTDTKYTLPAANGSTLGGVVTGGDITATNGTLTITNGKVTSTKIADDAVTTAKIKGFDNSGSTKECADGKCALVDLGSGAQWLPIVNEYPQPQQ